MDVNPIGLDKDENKFDYEYFLNKIKEGPYPTSRGGEYLITLDREYCVKN